MIIITVVVIVFMIPLMMSRESRMGHVSKEEYVI